MSPITTVDDQIPSFQLLVCLYQSTPFQRPAFLWFLGTRVELKPEFNCQLELMECHPILNVRILFTANNQILFKKYCVCTPENVNKNLATQEPTKSCSYVITCWRAVTSVTKTLLKKKLFFPFGSRDNGPQIAYVRDFKAKVHYFRFWCQVWIHFLGIFVCIFGVFLHALKLKLSWIRRKWLQDLSKLM